MRDRRPYPVQASNLAQPALHLHKQRVNAIRARGIDVIDLASADAHIGPPEAVLKRLGDRLLEDRSVNLYSSVPGLEDLRSALAQELASDFAIPPTNLIVTAGANNGVVLSLLAVTRVGETVAMPAPYFFNHAAQAELLGLDVVPISTTAADGHFLRCGAIEDALNCDGVAAALVSNPRNPTATRLDEPLLEQLAQGPKPIIIDESYRDFAPAHSRYAWEQGGNLIRVGSLSKSFGLAGWRIGYVAAPDQWIDALVRAQDALVIHPSVASQHIALEALIHRRSDDYVGRFADRVAADQSRLAERLRGMPWVRRVDGNSATFLWVTLPDGTDADAFASRLLMEHGVGVLASSAFGASEPAFRIGIACVPTEMLEAAWQRLKQVT